MKAKLLESARGMQEELVAFRRYLHQNPELSLELPITVNFVKSKLVEMGYEPQDCGKSGIVAIAGGIRPGKVFLIRGDMDALPVEESADVPFKSTNGNMHACGHDLHTAMLLGAAKLLKEMEADIQGQVKLMFQPAEETLAGAKNMIEAGVLTAPDVDAAMMIHVMTGFPLPAGKVIVSQAGLTAAASDWFEIHVQGKGGHGAMPNNAVDPINAATHIFQAIQTIHSRELAPGQAVALTIGKFVAGTTSNVIPDTAHMYGTLRTYEPETRTFVRERLEAIAKATAEALRATAEVKIVDGCPALNNDAALVDSAKEILKELLPESDLLDMSVLTGGGKMSGSEDFAYVSEKVPTLMLGLSAGNADEGYSFPQHHPKAIFDESVLSTGAAVYAYAAIRWLDKHSEA
ncbi:MAG: hypothetical protein PWP51_1041 [Clostridiales bacterium]|jgi:hippurate hydrolase|nr:hypothetical protein [Clostridiales bacterium]